MNLGQLFEFAVGRAPDSVALVDQARDYTYRELDSEVNRIASSLYKLGIGHRDRVMVLMKNRRQTVCLFWALQKLGAIFTPVNFYRSSKDISYCIEDIEPKAIIYEDFVHPRIPKPNLGTIPVYISLDLNDGDLTYSELVEKGTDNFSSNLSKPDDIAVMLYTSGTSGIPKGVPRSHNNEYSSTMAHIVQNNYQLFESTLGVMPLYHTMGLRSLISVTLLNGKYVAMSDFDSDLALSLIEQERVSCLYMIPTMYHEIISNGHLDTVDVSSVRKIGYAGAPMSASLIRACTRIFKPEIFLNHYGSTEIYTFSTCPHANLKPGTAGKPGINQYLRLVSLSPDASEDDEVEPTEVGQVIVNVRSSEAFKGYWNRPEVTREVIRGDWYFTGDVGRLDEDGDLFILGRVDEMVISGVDHVSPLKVEEVILGHPKVAEVAVVGEKDERWGQMVVAYVVPLDETLSVFELERFCKRNQILSPFEKPRKYVFINSLPKSPSGKILRGQLMSKGEGASE